MRYAVSWGSTAIDDLADIWNNAPDQQAVADAADEIERLLRRSPLSSGIPSGPFHRLTISPLDVLYEVSPDDMRVHVWVS